MRIKKVPKIQSSSNIRKSTKTKHPVLQSPLHRAKIDKKSHIKTSSPTKPMSLAEQAKQVEHMLKFYKNGLTIKTVHKVEDKDRVERAKKELKIFFVKSKTKEIFKFIVKSSGKHLMLKSYQIAEKYQAEVMWKDAKEMALDDKSPSYILMNSRIRISCSCPDFTFYSRFWLTKAKAVIGMSELRYPSKRNPNPSGFICKHQILLLNKLQNPAFLKVFNRYVDNLKTSKQTRIKESDKVSTHLSSGRSEFKK